MIDLSRNWQRLCSTTLTIDGIQKELQCDRQQVEQFYLPLAEQVAGRAADRPRFMVGIAGLPGCGKSAFSALLAAVLNIYQEQLVVVIGMDGWHYTNAYLETHHIQAGGTWVPLRQVKGAPETFDAQAMLEGVATIRRGEELSFPRYDRSLHDPIPGAGQVSAGRCIILVEGNYLLLDEAPWQDFRAMFDLTIFLRSDFEGITAALLARHMQGGRSEADALRHIQSVDLPNARRVLAGFSGADFLVYKQDVYHISRVDWQVDC